MLTLTGLFSRTCCAVSIRLGEDRKRGLPWAYFLTLFTALSLFASGVAQGNSSWTLPAGQSGDWSSSTNWSGGVPTVGATATIANGGTATITQLYNSCGTLNLGSGAGSGSIFMTSGSLETINQENVGYSGLGSFVQSAGTNAAVSWLFLGYNQGSSGFYSLSGSGQVSTTIEYVGCQGTGSFTQSAGTNACSAVEYIGGFVGSYTQSGGMNACSGPLSVGSAFGGLVPQITIDGP